MKVLLISANTETMNMPALPLGMACVAAAAREAGHEVHVLDLMAQEDPDPAIKNMIAATAPAVIGISIRNIDDQVAASPTFLLAPVKKVVAACRGASPAPIVLGGAGYSIFPQRALAYLEADMGIRGEGEGAFVTLLQRLAQNKDLSDVPGLHQRHATPTAPQYARNPDVFPLPQPGIDLILPESLNRDEVWIPFQTRRGCPLRCSYCSTASIEGRLIRRRSPERLLHMLRQFTAAGFHHFFIVDNVFNLPSSYTEAFCDEIINAGLEIKWRCILYPAPFSDKLADKMARAGCQEVSLGCESGAQTILNAMHKRFSTADVRNTVTLLKQRKIRVQGFLLLGGPEETRETVMESLTFMQSLALDAVKITTGLRIYPNTALQQTAIQEGLLQPDSDLLFPTFYLRQNLTAFLQDTVSAWTAKQPNWFR